jgi:hypothetical protein
MKSNLDYSIEIIGDLESSRESNVDVYISFGNSEKYFCTFFTVSNIEYLLKRYSETGENNYGRFFWATNMIILKEITLENMRSCVNSLLIDGTFHDAFAFVSSGDGDHFKRSLR